MDKGWSRNPAGPFLQHSSQESRSGFLSPKAELSYLSHYSWMVSDALSFGLILRRESVPEHQNSNTKGKAKLPLNTWYGTDVEERMVRRGM